MQNTQSISNHGRSPTAAVCTIRLRHSLNRKPRDAPHNSRLIITTIDTPLHTPACCFLVSSHNSHRGGQSPHHATAGALVSDTHKPALNCCSSAPLLPLIQRLMTAHSRAARRRACSRRRCLCAHSALGRRPPAAGLALCLHRPPPPAHPCGGRLQQWGCEPPAQQPQGST